MASPEHQKLLLEGVEKELALYKYPAAGTKPLRTLSFQDTCIFRGTIGGVMGGQSETLRKGELRVVCHHLLIDTCPFFSSRRSARCRVWYSDGFHESPWDGRHGRWRRDDAARIGQPDESSDGDGAGEAASNNEHIDHECGETTTCCGCCAHFARNRRSCTLRGTRCLLHIESCRRCSRRRLHPSLLHGLRRLLSSDPRSPPYACHACNARHADGSDLRREVGTGDHDVESA
jgi:hypothetical protein